MRPLLILLSLVLVGCASRPVAMPIDNFGVIEADGVTIEYPIGGGIDPMQAGSFYYDLAGSDVIIRKRRLYINGAFKRRLERGDRVRIPDFHTLVLNGQQVVPPSPGL